MADMDAIMKIASDHHLVVIEDAAQAIGAEFKKHRAGSLGDYGCFSFFPSKNLGGAGDGGMVITNDRSRMEKLMCLRVHGAKPKYHHKLIGGNFRLDALQAAIVLAKFPHLDNWTSARQRNAKRYNDLFKKTNIRIAHTDSYSFESPLSGKHAPASQQIDAAAQLLLPAVQTNRHVFNQYVIRLSNREQLQVSLLAKGVATEVYYPVPLHLQECFSYLGYSSGAFPESESAARETLALPIYPELEDEQAAYVVQCIDEFFSAQA